MPLVGGHGDGEAALGSAPVALALIAVVVRMQNPVHLPDADLAEVSEDAAGPKVHQRCMIRLVGIDDDVDRAGVLVAVQVLTNPLERCHAHCPPINCRTGRH